MNQFTGGDAELNKKFEESWALINFDAKEESDFMKKAEMAANMSGINAAPNFGGMPFGGGFAPNTMPKKDGDPAAHATFRSALPGMDDFLSKPKDEQK